MSLDSVELGVKIPTSCSKSPEPARTHSLGFACCSSDEIRCLFRLKWPRAMLPF